MTKNDFLDQLRNSLVGEMPEAEIGSNLRFYEDYINTNSRESDEQNVMEQLGDPRLIAKTIVETYQISHAPLYQNVKHDATYQDANATDEETYKSYYGNNSNSKKQTRQNFRVYSNMNWFQKLSLILLVLIIIVAFCIISGLLARFVLPLLFIYFIFKIVIRNRKR